MFVRKNDEDEIYNLDYVVAMRVAPAERDKPGGRYGIDANFSDGSLYTIAEYDTEEECRKAFTDMLAYVQNYEFPRSSCRKEEGAR